MVVAAVIIFGALLAAWLLAPTERAMVDRSAQPHPEGVAPTLTEGVAEAA